MPHTSRGATPTVIMRRFQRTDLRTSHNHELVLLLTSQGIGWAGASTRRRIGVGEGQAEPVTFATAADLEAFVARLTADGYRETALAERPQGDAATPAAADPAVASLLTWVRRAATDSVAGFLNGEVAALAPTAVAEARTVLAGISDLWDAYRAAPSRTMMGQIVEGVQAYYRLIPHRLPRRIRPEALATDFTADLGRFNDELTQLDGALAALAGISSRALTEMGCAFTPLVAGTAEQNQVLAFADRRLSGAPHRLRGIYRVTHPRLEARWTASTRGKHRVALRCHGSAPGNWASIFTLGLVTPAAQVNGWSLGAGIYFGDMIGKSLQYTRAPHAPGDPHGVLLCEVALGTPHVTGSYRGRSAPAGADSVESPAGGGYRWTEYVIFREEQHVPRYFIEIDA